MRTIASILASILVGSALFAQGVITRIGSDGTHFYYNGVADLQSVFDDALLNGPGVDTVLFGGGTFLLSTELQIASPVVVVGTGIRPDSSTVYGGVTTFNPVGTFSVLAIRNGADGSEFHGLTFGNAVRIGIDQADSDVDDIRFHRCHFTSLFLGNGTNSVTMANGVVVDQCVIRNDLLAQYTTGALVRNSFFQRIIYTDANTNMDVRNCVVLGFNGDGGHVPYQNSVFLTNAATLNVFGGSFVNCLFVGNGATFAQNVTFAPSITTNIAPQYATSLSAAFVDMPNVPAGVGYLNYQFNGNYASTPTYSVAPYLGNDGRPRGIYGGEAPWKNGSLPFNPHWTLLASPGSSAPNGVLEGVQIKASAQVD